MSGRVLGHAASTSRLKLAELTSTLGAGVLGAGAGVLLGARLDGLGLPLVAVGLILHAWGMRDKHALEADAPRPAWSTALYWACWTILAVLAVYGLARIVAG